MSTARILNPPRTVDPYSHQAERMAEMERRLALLEGAANARVQRFRRVLSTATNVNLLNFDGDSFTGIRISFVGAINGAGVGVAAPFIRLKPNGLTSLPTQSVGQRFYTPTPSYTPTTDVVYGGAFATTAGIPICQKSWNVNNGTEHTTFQGTFYTPTSNGWRSWDGTFTTRDLGADGNRGLHGSIYSTWQDNTTAITSMSLSIDLGSISGVIAVELLP